MKLGEFIQKFIEPNSIIRLVYKNDSGHEVVLDGWEVVSMEHEILNQKGYFRHYINNEVLGVTSIWVRGHHPDAINIVIERKENQEYLEEIINKQTTYQEKW